MRKSFLFHPKIIDIKGRMEHPVSLHRCLRTKVTWVFHILIKSALMWGLTTENVFSQLQSNTVISGQVIDAKTNEPLPFVTVALENTNAGTVTDLNGNYKLITIATSYRVSFSYIGYNPQSILISPGKTQVINIELMPAAIELDEIVVKPEKKRYRNRGNPAVDLIGNVIANKDRNHTSSFDFLGYHKYEKVTFSLSNLKEDWTQPAFFRKFPVLLNNLDTSRADGKKNIPLYLKETRSLYFYRRDPQAQKEFIREEKSVNLEEYVDSKGLTSHITYLYQPVDIYENDIFFLSNKFLSPVAAASPAFYKFYIADTLSLDGISCIQLFFEPRNPADFMFHGFLFVTNDSNYAIKRVDMGFSKKINIDWVNDARILQDYQVTEDKKWVLRENDISVDFGITGNTMGIYGQKQTWYSGYSINQPIQDSVFNGKWNPGQDANVPVQILPQEDSLPPLTYAEDKLYGIIDSVQKIPAFKRRMDLIMLLTTEFLDLGKVEIGPVGTFYSYNSIEGNRIKFGGRTTEQFSNHIFLDSYLAYGFRDQEIKYNLGTAYSLSGSSVYKFPVRSVKLNLQYDTEIPGQVLIGTTKDDILLSMSRGVDDKVIYNRSVKLEYLYEYENHFSYSLGYYYSQQRPAGNLYFSTTDELPLNNDISLLHVSEISLKLRYAPQEQFYQGKLYRAPIASKYPVVQIQGTLGSEEFGSDYNYWKFKANASKRFYFSIVGYTDISTEAGFISGKVPYPLLFMHNANQSYTYQPNAFNMMNFMEFASDRYAGLMIDHSFNGFFLNKIPIIKKFKLREVMTLKVLYGGIRQTNDPDYDPELFRFPADSFGNTTTFSLEQKPYIEGGIGLSNILRIFRVDLVKRFTYVSNPDISTIGLRVQFRLDI